ncbi:MAG: TIGR00269 family protein [Nitrososphaeraceae archaeon]
MLLSTKACTRCKNTPVVYQRIYSGEYLCRSCFLFSIEDKAKKSINKYSMLTYKDKVAVAVSGGKDSLSLLYILNKIYSKKDFLDIIAVTIDEGIPGYREEGLRIVKDFCSEIGIENITLKFTDIFGVGMEEVVSKRPSQKFSSCSFCGTFRRRAIDLISESVGSNVVATGHNLDDQLQTFMINLVSGDVERIGWIYPEPVEYGKNNIKKIKPLVEIYEHELVFYALQRGIPFQSEECPHKNESIRTDLRDFLNTLEINHPGIKYNAFNSAIKISKHLKGETPRLQIRRKCSICSRDSSSPICSVCKNMMLLNGSDLDKKNR